MKSRASASLVESRYGGPILIGGAGLVATEFPVVLHGAEPFWCWGVLSFFLCALLDWIAARDSGNHCVRLFSLLCLCAIVIGVGTDFSSLHAGGSLAWCSGAGRNAVGYNAFLSHMEVYPASSIAMFIAVAISELLRPSPACIKCSRFAPVISTGLISFQFLRMQWLMLCAMWVAEIFIIRLRIIWSADAMSMAMILGMMLDCTVRRYTFVFFRWAKLLLRVFTKVVMGILEVAAGTGIYFPKN